MTHVTNTRTARTTPTPGSRNPTGRNHPAASAGTRSGRGLRIVGWVAAAVLALMAIKWVLMTMVLLALPYALWWLIDRAGRGRRIRTEQAAAAQSAVRRRDEVESRAVVVAAGGCGWCGARAAHRDLAGRVVMPREYHRDDIERTLIAA